ncbi:phage tail protein [Methylotenera sp.]|uniref:phage tail protein n=1 Tax=Methylotenera sp. TaxID=2051956 RepID=UPI00248A75D4|nr:phage tail protein [Methylotenera sp.]MDI1362508.1 phage tail protein [Methylotenera sp.]
MPQTLPTTPIISPSSTKTKGFNIHTSQFGNGYREDAPLGINYAMEKWDISYEMLNATDRNAIIAVIEASGGWDIINWTAPGGTAKRYKMTKDGYSETRMAATYTIKFKLEQVP